MKKFIVGLLLMGAIIRAQNPQTQSAPIIPENAKYVNGVAPGYYPTAGSGLVLNVGPGTANCGGTIVTYAGGTLTLTASVTNYVYLNTSASCAPSTKTSAFTSSDIPLAAVVVGSSTITSITDDRTLFQEGATSYTLPQATTSVLGGVKPDGTTCTTTAGVLSCSGGSSNCLSGLTPSSSGASAANTAAINASLANGGTTYECGTPGTNYWVNGPLIHYSNSWLKLDPGVHNVSNNPTASPMDVNYEETQPFTASSGCASPVGSTCVLDFPSHGLPVGNTPNFGGQWVYAQANENFLDGTGATITYSSGLSSCPNGTINVSVTNGAGASLGVVGTITVSGGVPTGNVTLTALPSPGTWGIDGFVVWSVAGCTGTAVFTYSQFPIGNIDGAYSGIFRVISVPDSDHLLIQLNHVPKSYFRAPSTGFYAVKLADTNITLENLTLDFQNPGSNFYHTVVMFGVHNFNTYGTFTLLNSSQTNGYGLYAKACDDCHVRNYTVQNYEKEGALQWEGPITNSSFEQASNFSTDVSEGLTMDSVGSTFAYTSAYPEGGGDLLNFTFDGIHDIDAIADDAVVYGNGLPQYSIDNVWFKNGDAHVLSTSTTPNYSIQQTGGIIGGGNNVGTVGFENIKCEDDKVISGTYPGIYNPCILADTNFKNLIFKNISGSESGTYTNNVTLIDITDVGYTGENLIVDGIRMTRASTSAAITGISFVGPVAHVDVSHADIELPLEISVGSSIPVLVYQDSTSAVDVHIHDSVSNTACGTLVYNAVSGPTISVDHNTYSCGIGSPNLNAMLRSTAAATWNVSNNNVPNGWLFDLEGTFLSTINDGGGNWVYPLALRYYGTTSGSPTLSIFGGCSDAFVDIASAPVLKTNGACVSNFNSASGFVGPNIADGTYWRPTAGGFHVQTPSIGGTLLTVGCNNQATITVTGVQTGMACSMSGVAGNPANVQPQCSVSAANTITPSLCTAATSVTPATQVYNITVN